LRIFLDSSALVKRYIEESGSSVIAELLAAAAELGVSVLCVPEIISALNRRRREKVLAPAQYRQIKAALGRDVADAWIVPVSIPVVGAAIGVLEHSPVRAMDALHVAAARVWTADLFVSADARQLAAAEAAGLAVRPV